MSELELVISGLADSLCLHTYLVINCFCVTIITHKVKQDFFFFYSTDKASANIQLCLKGALPLNLQ